jgi:hypothetical protein
VLPSVSVSRSGSTVTASSTGHGLSSGDRVRISACSTAALNGEFVITKIDANSFSYVTTSSGAVGSTSATGQKLARDLTVVRAGTGNFTVTHAVNMPDVNYSVLGSVYDVSGAGVARLIAAAMPTVSGFSAYQASTATGALVNDVRAVLRIVS